MFKKSFIISLGLTTLTLPLVGVVSCGNLNTAKWDEEIKIVVKDGGKENPPDGPAFARKLAAEINTLKAQNSKLKDYPDVSVKFDMSGEDASIVQDISAGNADFGISSFTAVNKGNHDYYQPIVQTKTNSFAFDPIWNTYQDGLANDPLIKVASQTNQMLTTYPYANWKAEDYNGAIYEKYYDLTKKVDFYRGAIYIGGTSEEVAAIEQAWKERDWETFRNFGIISGEANSGGQWLLQEALLKKHFVDQNNQPLFDTLSVDKLNHQDKYQMGKYIAARDLNNGTLSGYHIAFDDEGVFAWTNRHIAGQAQNNYFNPQGGVFKVLSATDPLKYDVGIMRHNFLPAEGTLIAKALINLSDNNQDNYGPSAGYNGYGLITDPQSEIYDKYTEVMG